MHHWIGPFDEGGDTIPPAEGLTLRGWATWIAYNWDATQNQGLLRKTGDDHRQDLFVQFLEHSNDMVVDWPPVAELWNTIAKKMQYAERYGRDVYAYPPEMFHAITERFEIMETPDDCDRYRSGEDWEHCPLGGGGPSGLEDAPHNG